MELVLTEAVIISTKATYHKISDILALAVMGLTSIALFENTGSRRDNKEQ